MSKKNCWEIKGCERQPGGEKADELGVCPAAAEDAADGINSGRMGGRACWALAGTLCGGEVQGTFATKLANCMQCDFYVMVFKEEGDGFCHARVILDRIAERKKKQ